MNKKTPKNIFTLIFSIIRQIFSFYINKKRNLMNQTTVKNVLNEKYESINRDKDNKIEQINEMNIEEISSNINNRFNRK